MPLPMVHLSTAVKINTLQGLKSPEFYLGSISPDAVHMRAGFVPNDKTRSHCNARVLAAINELDSFENDVMSLLDKYKLDKWMIRLELTERLNASSDDILLYGKKLNERGIRLEIDDFGSHFTNLGFLDKDVFSVVKIDRTIVNKLVEDSVTSKVIDVIVKECHNCGMTVLAEGVENIEELNYIKKLNIDLVQGYYYDRPIIPEEFVNKYFKKD